MADIDDIRDMGRLSEFHLLSDTETGVPVVHHKTCGEVVVQVPSRGSVLWHLAADCLAHNCSIGGLIARRSNGHPWLQILCETSRGLCEDTPANADSEYARGVAEVLCSVLGIDTDRKDEVAAWLCR